MVGTQYTDASIKAFSAAVARLTAHNEVFAAMVASGWTMAVTQEVLDLGAEHAVVQGWHAYKLIRLLQRALLSDVFVQGYAVLLVLVFKPFDCITALLVCFL
jgi:hypothetical protein